MNLFSILGLDNNFSLNIQYPLNIYHLSVSHNYMKSTYSILLFSVILMSLSPITVLSDFVKEDDIKVQLFKKGKKRPILIPQNKFVDDNSFYEVFKDYKGYRYDFIDKIEIKVVEPKELTILVLRLQEYVEDKPVDTIFNEVIQTNPKKNSEVFIGNSVGDLSDWYSIIIKNGEQIVRQFSYWIR